MPAAPLRDNSSLGPRQDTWRPGWKVVCWVVDDDSCDDLIRARQALDVAYEAARHTGYKLGSRQMQALDRAEQHYEHAQRAQRAQRQVLRRLDPAGEAVDNVVDLGDRERPRQM